MDIIWEKTVSKIKEKISSQNFETWITPIKIVSKEEGNVQLSVPNKFFRDWLVDNYFSVIKNCLYEVTDVELNISFIISQDSGKNLLSTDTKANQREASYSKKIRELNPILL